MKKTLIITDLTQMPNGNEVCVVGIDEAGICIRPVCQGGFLKKYLFNPGGNVLIRPRAKVEFDLYPIACQSPHIEDMIFNPASIKGKGLCNDKEWESALQLNSYVSVSEIYGGFLQENSWVKPGAKTRSIATLSVVTIVNIELTPRQIKPRLIFKDGLGCKFDCPTSDLTLWNRCLALARKQGRNPIEVKTELVALLQNVERLYLRLGLARPWERIKGEGERCWLQVTGAYTFPDYMNDKSFADF
jgi:hypothetical protein